MKGKPDFAAMFGPGRIGAMTLRNRLVLPAMGTNLGTEEGYVTDRLKNYHRARAKGGVGLSIIELVCVDPPIGKVSSRQLCIDDDRYIPGLRELARAIQQEGARAAIQLHHTGGAAISSTIGSQPVAPSPIRRAPIFDVPRALTVEEIKTLVSCFATAARRAKEAGFDGIEIHAAHSYLLQQFLSRTFNHRQDEYGGSLGNRARFLLEIIGTIRSSVGKDYPLWCRINGEEIGGGITIDEAKEVARMTEEAGVDAINISGSPSVRPSFSPRGWGLTLAQEIKKVVNVPVIVVGRLTLELGEEALLDGKADFIALGRPLIVDPDLPLKVSTHQEEDVRPCIECNLCIEEYAMAGRELECSVNSAVGREVEYRIEPADRSKKVLVVGGGPAGMEAARVAALRGHRVMLYDRDDRLGGQLLLAAEPPYKSDLALLKEYQVRQAFKAGVEIVLKKDVDAALVANMKPDVVILATGILPLIPQIPGINRDNVVTAEDVLSHKVKVGERVIILGGGIVGCETALLLADQGKKVSIVEMLPAMATKMVPSIREALLGTLAAKGVVMLTGIRVEEITLKGMGIRDPDGKPQMIDADNIVLATGAISNNQPAESLRGKVEELYVIGDAMEPRRIKEAISEGFNVGRKI